MARKDELERWWDGLTEQERTDALESRDTGQLSDSMEKSLEKAGLIQQEERSDPTIPDDVREYLDEQAADEHPSGQRENPPGGPLPGGKMRH